MRRKDREVTDRGRINEIIMNSHCCRLGFYDDGEVYIVPMNFGYEEIDETRLFYFHCAKEGRKIDLIEKTHTAGFELDSKYELIEGTLACEYTAKYQSVIGCGMITLVEEEKEKEHALQTIMLHSTGKGNWDFSQGMLHAVCILKLEVRKLSCKEHL